MTMIMIKTTIAIMKRIKIKTTQIKMLILTKTSISIVIQPKTLADMVEITE